MGRIALGFIIGVAVTAAVAFYLDERKEMVATTPSNTSVESSPGRRPNWNSSASVEDAAESKTPLAASPGEPVLDSRGPASGFIDTAGIVPPPDQPTGGLRSGGERDIEGNQEKRPLISVPDEIAPILEDSRPSNLHSQLESEEREASWAAFMEGQITAYLAQKPALQTYSIVLVECRTSLCEIQAIGYGPAAQVVWLTETSDMPSQPWFEFSDMSNSVRDVAPDTEIYGILTILIRKVG
jgi:hypothetical protein